MASYFSSLLTTTTSRVATLRQNLLPSEADGETKEDTHLCRVLRAYYTEKGRGLPGWLPADPRAQSPAIAQQGVQTSNNYGGRAMEPAAGNGAVNGGTGGQGLKALFGNKPGMVQEVNPVQERKRTVAGSPWDKPASGGSQDVAMDRRRIGYTPSPGDERNYRNAPAGNGSSRSGGGSEESFSSPMLPRSMDKSQSNGGEYNPPRRVFPGGLPTGPRAGRQTNGSPSGPWGHKS